MSTKFTDALAYTSRLCSTTEYCHTDITEKIRRFELDPDEEQALIERLEKDGFLDETRYAKAYVNDKFQLNKWGRIKIQSYLKQKRVPTEIIHEALCGLDEARYTKTLIDLLKRKDKSQRCANNLERRAKLYRFALGRGFEVPLVNNCLNHYLHEEHELDQE